VEAVDEGEEVTGIVDHGEHRARFDLELRGERSAE